MSERKSRTPYLPSDDTNVINELAELSHRLFDRSYIPPYKTGEAFLEHFVNKSTDERTEEFHFEPDAFNLDFAFKEIPNTYLGANYDYLLYEKEKRAGRRYGRWGTTERMSDIKGDIERILADLSIHVARLEGDPTYRYIETISTYTASTRHEAEAALRYANFGEDLKRTRFMDDNLDDIKQLIERQMLLNSLGFNLQPDNTIVRGPNFATRALTDVENATRVVELWWGWGNPHIFYAKDTTEVKGDTPSVSIIEQLVVASAYDIAKHFALLHTDPQDMKMKFPADPQPKSEKDNEEVEELIEFFSNILKKESSENADS